MSGYVEKRIDGNQPPDAAARSGPEGLIEDRRGLIRPAGGDRKGCAGQSPLDREAGRLELIEATVDPFIEACALGARLSRE